MTADKARALSFVIVDWFRDRNAGEFSQPMGEQRVMDRALMLEELTLILEHEERPPNWVKR